MMKKTAPLITLVLLILALAGIPLGIIKISDSKSFSYSGNILYLIPIHCLSIYVTGGLGVVTMIPMYWKQKLNCC